MSRYRTLLMTMALGAALMIWPTTPAHAADGPMRLADFAGQWSHHGAYVVVRPDGTGDLLWRTYRWCDDPGVAQPCDARADSPLRILGGHASLTFDRAEDRTAYGTISASNDERMLPNGPISLTEYQFGIGYAMLSHEPPPIWPGSPQDGIILCGPRYDTAPPWVTRQRPCGA